MPHAQPKNDDVDDGASLRLTITIINNNHSQRFRISSRHIKQWGAKTTERKVRFHDDRNTTIQSLTISLFLFYWLCTRTMNEVYKKNVRKTLQTPKQKTLQRIQYLKTRPVHQQPNLLRRKGRICHRSAPLT